MIVFKPNLVLPKLGSTGDGQGKTTTWCGSVQGQVKSANLKLCVSSQHPCCCIPLPSSGILNESQIRLLLSLFSWFYPCNFKSFLQFIWRCFCSSRADWNSLIDCAEFTVEFLTSIRLNGLKQGVKIWHRVWVLCQSQGKLMLSEKMATFHHIKVNGM